MQEQDKYFDLKLRSVLDGAEEEVPQRVWEGVSGRLGHRRRPVAWVRWGSVGLAAAAAVALSLVVGNSLQNTVPSPAVSEREYVARNIMPQSEDFDVEPEMAIPEGIGTATVCKKDKIGAGDTYIPEQIVVKSVPETAAAEAANELVSTQEEMGTRKEVRDKKEYVRKEAWDDPFARMAYEDSHKKVSRGTKVGLNGLVGTNDGARFGPAGGGAWGTSGSHSPSGISEDSETIFGIPVSIGVGVRRYLNEKLSVSAGINWSSLNRKFEGQWTDDRKCSEIRHNVQYVGIPVTLNYDIISNDVLDFYTFAGGSIEKCISDRYRSSVSGEALSICNKPEGMQYSAAIGLGVQFNLSERLGIYLDPSARYWMGKNNPKSIRTQQPLMFNIEVGLRFEL